MKKIIWLIIVVLLVLITVMVYKIRDNKEQVNGFKVGTFLIKDKKMMLWIADSPNKWTQGLMNITQKPKNIDGMIFLFDDYEDHTFWNKDTLLDLRLIWMRDDMVVGESSLPSITKTVTPMTIQSPTKVNKVIELIQ